jgi:hypothetical protein
LIERAVGKLSLSDQMKLEGSNVFAGRLLEWLFDKVGKLADVIGVGIDGGLSQVTDHHVFGEPLSELAGSFLVGCHVGLQVERRELLSFQQCLPIKKAQAPPYRNVRFNRNSVTSRVGVERSCGPASTSIA